MRNPQLEWFTDARFGLFIHYGPSAESGGAEWVRSNLELDDDAYQKYVDAFDPISFDADALAELAIAAGMKYGVLVAKHHDGFALFDTAVSDYSIAATRGRDLVAEFVAAFRSRGLGVGLYFSLLDWNHPGYPAYGDAHHPMRNNPEYTRDPEAFAGYLDFLHAQVRELCTNYGTLDVVWFDFSYGELRGEAWGAGTIVEILAEHQPNAIINNRLEGSGGELGSLERGERAPWAGDFVSPEQLVPAGGVVDGAGAPVPWESNLTSNNSWGYRSSDTQYKSPRLIIRKLVECVSNSGNLLVNIGPEPAGGVPPRAESLLRGVGSWLTAHGESIYGAGVSEFAKPDWGRYTQRGSTVYAHVFDEQVGPLALTGIPPERIEKITLLATGAELKPAVSTLLDGFTGITFVSWGNDDPSFTYPLPDPLDTVLRIDLH